MDSLLVWSSERSQNMKEIENIIPGQVSIPRRSGSMQSSQELYWNNLIKI